MKLLHTTTGVHSKMPRGRIVTFLDQIGFNMYPHLKVRFFMFKNVIGQGKMPSPVDYIKSGFFSPKQTKNSFSFGVSRDNMKKLHIQAIEKMALDKLPGPN
jgi:hypothetical protein